MRSHSNSSGEELLKQDSLLSYISGLRRVLGSKYFFSHQEEILKNIIKMSAFGQIRSKVWLRDVLIEKQLFQLGNVFLCAGWYGLLPLFLLHEKKFFIRRLFNFEKDPLSVKVSEDLNREFVKEDWKFKAVLQDILELDYKEAEFSTRKASGKIQNLRVSPDTILNTSCEHFANFSAWWDKLPSKKLLILQSNNFFEHKDHVNCVSSLEEFQTQVQMDYLYKGSLHLEGYQRFMLIGRKK